MHAFNKAELTAIGQRFKAFPFARECLRILVVTLYDRTVASRYQITATDLLTSVGLFKSVTELYVVSGRTEDDPDMAAFISKLVKLQTLVVTHEWDAQSHWAFTPRPSAGYISMNLSTKGVELSPLQWNDVVRRHSVLDISSLLKIAISALKDLENLALERVTSMQDLSQSACPQQLQALHVSRSSLHIKALRWLSTGPRPSVRSSFLDQFRFHR